MLFHYFSEHTTGLGFDQADNIFDQTIQVIDINMLKPQRVIMKKFKFDKNLC